MRCPDRKTRRFDPSRGSSHVGSNQRSIAIREVRYADSSMRDRLLVDLRGWYSCTNATDSRSALLRESLFFKGPWLRYPDHLFIAGKVKGARTDERVSAGLPIRMQR